MTEQPEFSDFAAGVTTETAFDVLAIARQLKAAGKTVIELEIGDSPFATTPAAAAAGQRPKPTKTKLNFY